MLPCPLISTFFFFNDTATTEIYTLSLHDALPISIPSRACCCPGRRTRKASFACGWRKSSANSISPISPPPPIRSEEHTSELQSHSDLVCRLLLEKKKSK